MNEGKTIAWAAATFALALCTAVLPVSVTAQIPDSTQVADSIQVLDSSQATDSILISGSTQALDSMPVRAPLPDVVLTHLAYLTEAFAEAPGGMGLIPAGMAEAEIAAEYVRLAGQDSNNLDQMVQNMAHVLHAIDPNEVGNGFGLGYGVRRAAESVITNIEVVVNSEEVPENVLFHLSYATGAASGALLRAEQAIALARQIQRATDPEVALPMIETLAELVRAMAYGDDADGDGRIGYSAMESGLAQATYHLTLLRRVEGLGG